MKALSSLFAFQVSCVYPPNIRPYVCGLMKEIVGLLLWHFVRSGKWIHLYHLCREDQVGKFECCLRWKLAEEFILFTWSNEKMWLYSNCHLSQRLEWKLLVVEWKLLAVEWISLAVEVTAEEEAAEHGILLWLFEFIYGLNDTIVLVRLYN